MTIISISDDSPNRFLADKHYVNLSPSEQVQFEEYAEGMDMTIAQLRSDFVYRAIWNRMVQSDIYRAVPEQVVRPKQDALFDL